MPLISSRPAAPRILLVLTALVAACAVGPEEGVVDTTAMPDSMSHGASIDSGAASDTGINACAITGADSITGTGIGELQIGMRIDDLKRRCRVLADTSVLAAEGMLERQARVDVGIDTLMAVLADDLVARIHLRTPRVLTGDSLGVGIAATEFGRYANARVITGEGRMFVTIPRRCGLSFRLTGPARTGDPTLAELPAGTKVDEVLVVGC